MNTSTAKGLVRLRLPVLAFWFVLCCAVGVVCAQKPAKTSVVDLFREYDQLASQALWPGFSPRETPIAVFDGEKTFLYRHPKPPEGFRPLEGVPGVLVYPGRHSTVVANTNTDVNGVPTATADIHVSRRSPRQLAALLVHEAFHVYGHRTHPKWAANEVALFTYPVMDSQVLAGRRLETIALVKAVQAENQKDSACWAAAALAERQQRAERMPAESVQYERGTELNEGLAQYVEDLSIQKPPVLRASDFPADRFRLRGYATGQSYATLLDRFAPDWKSQIGDSPLDQLLRARVPDAGAACNFTPQERAAQEELARRDIEQLAIDLKGRRQQLLEAPGWTVSFVAGKEPFWPQGFNPWDITVLSSREVLHPTLLKVGNKSGSIEILHHGSLTEAAGPHPLVSGVAKLIVTGLDRPKVTEADGKVSIEGVGISASFTGSVEQSGHVIVVQVR